MRSSLHSFVENAQAAAEHALMKRWVDQWKMTGPELERIRKEELRGMTEEEAFLVAERLSCYSVDDVWIEPLRRESRGFIQQQRLFLKSRKRAE